MKKYELTDNAILYKGHTLRQIRLVRDCFLIESGTLGGYIESEENLSQEGNSLVLEEGKVFGRAVVKDNAVVSGCGAVFDNAILSEHASISGNAEVSNESKVFGVAVVTDQAKVNCAKVYGSAQIFGNALIAKGGSVSGWAAISGHVRVSTEVCGSTCVCGNANLYTGTISSSDQILTIEPIGSRDDATTFIRSDNEIYVACGCFRGTIKEFEMAVLEKHTGRYRDDYLDAISFAKQKLSRNGG